jgi:thiamine biosynthesis lipoprotein
VGVADPAERGRPRATLRLRDAFVSTSAQSERARLVGGRLLGHVLDPRTGEPAERRGGATVVAPSGLAADAWSTALLVLGREALASLALPALFLEPEDGRLALHSNPAGSALVHDTGEGLRFEIHR